jgi:hypothetical protein
MIPEHTAKETLWAETPEDVANKIIQVWGLNIAVPFEDPEAIALGEQERQPSQRNKVLRPGLRPGDRRR